MQDFEVITELPAKRYVKRYLEVNYGTPAEINNRSFIGKFFYMLVEDSSQENDKKIKLTGYKDMVTLKLTTRCFFRKGCILTPTNIVLFNSFVEDVIKSGLEHFMLGAVKVGKKKKAESYYGFMDLMSMSETDFPYETIKKHVDRKGIFKNTLVTD